MNINLPADLAKQGVDVFGSKKKFMVWLEKENFFFDKKAPLEFVKTHNGIEFIKVRLTAMNFGDNI